MASGYNRIIIVGNLTRDPELRQLPSGQPVCRLNVASNRQFRNRQTGDMVQEVCYVDVDVWGAQAETSRQYLQKGRPVLIEGRLKLDSWQDQQGNARSKHSIVADRVVFLSSAAAESNDQSVESGEELSASSEALSPLEPRNEVERELMSQLDQIKSRSSSVQSAPKARPVAQAASAQQSTTTSTPAGTPFKDEPPFQDDLPF